MQQNCKLLYEYKTVQKDVPSVETVLESPKHFFTVHCKFKLFKKKYKSISKTNITIRDCYLEIKLLYRFQNFS